MQVAIERPADARVLVQSDSLDVAISPNGRWMAYQSNVSGRTEIYVERYPELRKSATDFDEAAGASHSGRVTARNCSLPASMAGRCSPRP